MTDRTYRSGGAGAIDRSPTISGGVPSTGVRVWTVWESNAGGAWHLYASSVDIPLGAVEDERVPAGPRLSPAWPNPFNGTTHCELQLATRSVARVAVADLLGREIAVLVEGELDAGTHTAVWDAAGAASGVYVIRLTTGTRSEATRVVVLR
jgi:hypothetical protein